jgi:hypothetical protein
VHALGGNWNSLGSSGFLFAMRLGRFELGCVFDARARAIGAGCVLTSAAEPQAQLLRHVLVDRAGVGLLLRDAQFRQ